MLFQRLSLYAQTEKTLLFLYNIFLMCYALGIRFASLFHAKAKQFVVGRRGLFEHLETALSMESRKIIWMHCASLGEFEQSRPVLEALCARFPNHALLLTFFSPSGFEIRKNYDGADYIFYLPTDSKRHALKFINCVQPIMALFVKYEFWYHYLNTLRQQGIPTILFSAYFQTHQPFFKWYGVLYRRMLQCYRQIFVQDERSKKLLESIGISNVTIAGDTRFDRAAKVLASPRTYPKVDIFKENKTLIVAGSTWPEDEMLLKKVLGRLPNDRFKLLVVPHEIRPSNIERVLRLFASEACLWDVSEDELKKRKIAVIPEVGHLSFLYRYADIAWIGGGFGKGIHNILEPAVFGVPVFFGPKYNRFREAMEMIRMNAVGCIQRPEELTALLSRPDVLKQMAIQAKNYVNGQIGATQKIMDYLSEKCLANVS